MLVGHTSRLWNNERERKKKKHWCPLTVIMLFSSHLVQPAVSGNLVRWGHIFKKVHNYTCLCHLEVRLLVTWMIAPAIDPPVTRGVPELGISSYKQEGAANRVFIHFGYVFFPLRPRDPGLQTNQALSGVQHFPQACGERIRWALGLLDYPPI